MRLPYVLSPCPASGPASPVFPLPSRPFPFLLPSPRPEQPNKKSNLPTFLLPGGGTTTVRTYFDFTFVPSFDIARPDFQNEEGVVIIFLDRKLFELRGDIVAKFHSTSTTTDERCINRKAREDRTKREREREMFPTTVNDGGWRS